MVWTIFENLRVQKNLNIEKIIFKVVQMKFLAMHITNKNLSFDIFTVGNLQNIFMEHDLNILKSYKIFPFQINAVLLHFLFICEQMNTHTHTHTHNFSFFCF